VADLKQRNARADEMRETLSRAGDELAARIEKLESALDRLALDAREALARDAAYRRDLDALERAATIHARAIEKAEQSERDRAEKGRAYENDALFMYLWRRRYGTSDYSASRLIEWLDGKVAERVGYHGARANYAILTEIPVRLHEHVAMLAGETAAAQKKVDDAETDKIRELARADLPGQLRAARTAETENRKAFETIAGELSDLGEQLNKYAEGQDPAFRKAVEMSAEFLGQERTERLLQLARETPGPSDDQIVDRIAKLDDDIAAAAGTIASKTHDLEKLFEKRDELVRIAADFRRAHYDDGGSVFRGRDIGAILLEELIRGAITGAEYWARTRGRQSWRRRPADAYRRSESFPPFDDLFGGFGDDDRGRGGKRRRRDDDDDYDDDDDDDDFRSGGRF
ncbi:MAG: hypothetical protein KKB37_12440, partial [Alphaproteobacteria bacterium]|nr:hypothetical protein [Alphaproteobacteria bacterium]